MKNYSLALLLAAAAFAAHAEEPAEATTPAEPGQDAVVIEGEPAAKADEDSRCLTQTGTRLRHRDSKGCVSAPGQAFTREDIDRTGAVDTADAVRRLTVQGTVRRGNAGPRGGN
ncbi:MAG TPA: hypothetical protein VKZ64_07645 [Arenimonas sp.]|jgi:outer membrane cobalamin receptor|nr:hypothetical protein [Arenimonas sp.]